MQLQQVISFADYCSRIWQKWLPSSETSIRVSYRGVQYFASGYPSISNLVPNVPPLPVDTLLPVDDFSDIGGRQMVQSDQNNAGLVKERRAVFQSLSVGEAWTCGVHITERECLLLDRHERIVRCDKNDSCIQKSINVV